MAHIRTTFTRMLPGLAPAHIQSILTRQPSSVTLSSSSRPAPPSRVAPSSSFTPSTFVAGSQPVTSIRSSKPNFVKTPASMPTRTESSILRHIERLRQTRPAQAVPVSAATLIKPPTVTTSTTASRSAPSRPVTRPASRVPSSSSAISSSSSSAARHGTSIEAHKMRISKARERRSPTSSSRPSPAISRKVTPTQMPAPLVIKKRSAAVDLATVNSKLESLSVAPAPLLVVKAKPIAPALRSCLKAKTSTRPSNLHAHFARSEGWNVHRIRAFDPASPATSFIPLDDAVMLPPSQYARSKGPVYANDRVQRGQFEYRWPPPDHDGLVQHGYDYPPIHCRDCADLAAYGTKHIGTRYHYDQQSVRCNSCMADLTRLRSFVPALDCNGEDDHYDTCQGDHGRTADTCGYLRAASDANFNWLYNRYPGLFG